MVESKLLSVEKKLKRVSNISAKVEKLSSMYSTKTPKTIASSKGINLSENIHQQKRPVEAMGPLQASLSPMQMFFDKLKFFKKAPLAKKYDDEKISDQIEQVDQRVIALLKNSDKQELVALNSWEGLSRKKNIYDSTPNVKPVRSGWYTSPFGMRTDPFTGVQTMHSGLDIAAAPGTPIYSPADGVVSYVGFESGYGNLVTIDHGYGVKTRYAHNSEVFVKFGQKIERGQKIAAVGNTGRSSGYHLHYEVRVNGLAVNPKNYIFD